MTPLGPEQWQRVQELFDQAVALPESQREAWVREACLREAGGADAALCDEVLSLLAHDRATAQGSLANPIKEAVLQFEGRAIPRRLGPYELLEQIGQGGMGAVYKAARVDAEYRSTVAIKLMRPGLDAGFVLGRFRRERQTLAKLTHPNIARLLDGGTSDSHDGLPGTPYIVMEYISGAVISEYCRARRLSVHERIALFLPVISAVDYAHRNFVIHRDIKPGNILVDQDGVPKLLDFGICKLLLDDQLEAGATQSTLTQGFALMTPDYASPEQARGEAVSPSSDVYALGLVLYELLTEQAAQHIEKYTPLGIQEAVCQKEVLLPSKAAIPPALSATLRGDLDNILMKALQKEPARRYESAAALAADLERYLRDEPVQARPDTTFYRAKKFVKRNRLAVGAAATILLVAGVGGGVALRQSHLAREQEQQARELARDGLFRVYDSINDLPGSTAARQQLITSALSYLQKLESSHPTDPTVLRELAGGYQRIGELQGGNTGSNLGEGVAAAENYRSAIRIWERLLAASPKDPDGLWGRGRALLLLADLEGRAEGPDKALGSLGKGIESARELVKQLPQDARAKKLLSELLMATANRYRVKEQFQTAESNAREALDWQGQVLAALPKDAEETATMGAAEGVVGMIQGRLGRLDDALAHYQRNVAFAQQALVLQPTSVNSKRNLAIAYSHVGDVLANPVVPNLGREEEAVKPYEEMLALTRELRTADPLDARGAIDLAFAQYRLAVVLPAARARERGTLFESSGGILRQMLAKAPNDFTLLQNLAIVESYFGDHFGQLGEQTEALRHYREAMTTVGKLRTARNTTVLLLDFRSGIALAVLQAKTGDLQDALHVLDRLTGPVEKEAARLGTTPLIGDDLIAGRSLAPRLYAAYATIHAIGGNKTEAENWRRKAEQSWQQFERLAGFDEHFRRQMEAWRRTQSANFSARLN